jgi:hypothetical protein
VGVVKTNDKGPLEPILGLEEIKNIDLEKRPSYLGTLMVATYNPLSEVLEPHHWKEMSTSDKKNLLLFFFISQEAQKPMKKN